MPNAPMHRSAAAVAAPPPIAKPQPNDRDAGRIHQPHGIPPRQNQKNPARAVGAVAAQPKTKNARRTTRSAIYPVADSALRLWF